MALVVDGKVYEFEAVPAAAPHYVMSYAKPQEGQGANLAGGLANDPRLEGCVDAVYHGRRAVLRGSSAVAKARPTARVLDAKFHESAEKFRCAAAARSPLAAPAERRTSTRPRPHSPRRKARLKGRVDAAMYRGRSARRQGSSSTADGGNARPTAEMLDVGESHALTFLGQGVTTIHEAAEQLRCAAAAAAAAVHVLLRMPLPTAVRPCPRHAPRRQSRPATVKKCKKDVKDRRERMEKDALEGLLFQLFERQPLWAIDALVERTEQPELYLREVLQEVAVRCKKRRRSEPQLWELHERYARRDA